MQLEVVAFCFSFFLDYRVPESLSTERRSTNAAVDARLVAFGTHAAQIRISQGRRRSIRELGIPKYLEYFARIYRTNKNNGEILAAVPLSCSILHNGILFENFAFVSGMHPVQLGRSVQFIGKSWFA